VDFETILFEQSGAVATITLNRPEALNAISPTLEAELHQALDVADADSSVHAIILTGAGRAFSSGYDISGGDGGPERVPPSPVGPYLRDRLNRSMSDPKKMLHIMELGTPVIAAINGWCIGGGFFYSLPCDITIASDRAVFALPEVRMISNSTFLFAAIAGWKVAHRYTLTGDHFDAAEALRIGVINEVVPHDDLMTRATALAERLANVPPDSVRLNKLVTTYGLEAMGLSSALNINGMLSAFAHASGDGPDVAHLEEARKQGGLRAFLEARDGPFLPEPFGPRSRVSQD